MNAAQHPITYPESEDPSVFRVSLLKTSVIERFDKCIGCEQKNAFLCGPTCCASARLL